MNELSTDFYKASISSVQFSFVPQAEHSYLLSAADDGSCRLWKFNKETRIFSRNVGILLYSELLEDF